MEEGTSRNFGQLRTFGMRLDLEEIFNRPVVWIAISLFVPLMWTAASWLVGELAMQMRRPSRVARGDKKRK